jgi:hypothetical protein
MLGEVIGGHTRYLVERLLADLRWLLPLWLAGFVVVAVWSAVTGEMPLDEALRLVVIFLPLLVPLTPLTWLRHQSRARTPKALPAIRLGCVWSLLTFPLAIGASVFIARWLVSE